MKDKTGQGGGYDYWVTIQVRAPSHDRDGAMDMVKSWLKKTTMCGVPLKSEDWEIDGAEREEA